MASAEACPNCWETLGKGLLKSNQMLHPAHNDLINLVAGKDDGVYCQKCGGHELDVAHVKARHELNTILKEIEPLLSAITLASIHSPIGWEYQVLDIVTAQSTIGTGIFTNLKSGFSDIFGQESKGYNSKIRQGENNCKKSLQMQAARLGADALIGVDVDYGDVGGQQSLMMICMTGTAIRLRNRDVLPDHKHVRLDQLGELITRFHLVDRVFWASDARYESAAG